MSVLETVGTPGAAPLNQAIIGRQIATIEHLIGALHELLLAENKLLESAGSHIPEGTARDKLQLIVQFNRASLEISELVLPDALQVLLQETVQLLEQNEKALQNRMAAIREVTRTMALAEQEAESDGTYSTEPRNWNLM